MSLDRASTANVWRSIPPKMLRTLVLYQKQLTPLGATSDLFGPPITFPVCRKRELTYALVLQYGPSFDLSRSRLFEFWDAKMTVASGGGITLVSGAGTPGAGTGSNGDWYYDTTNSLLYGPKASGAWPAVSTEIVPRSGDKFTESDGSVWFVQTTPRHINDHVSLAIAIPGV